jgi:diguanylate cyclase (GGDEF)-like protein
VRQVWGRLVRLTEVSHADRRVARQGRIVLSLLYAMIGLALCFLPLATVMPRPGAVRLAVCLATVLFAGIALVIRRGRVLLGSGLMLATYTAALFIGVTAGHRVGVAPEFVALAITMAGATLGVRHVLATLGVSLATLGGMALISRHSPPTTVTVTQVIIYSALLCALTAVVSAVTAYAVRQTLLAEDAALVRSQQLSAALREVNQSLELRVSERTTDLESALRSQTALASTLAELSVRDPLTGLHNRRHLDAEIVRMFEESVRYGRPICFALLDLDSFKTVNDAYGHDSGDEVLRRVARILVECTRAADLVARYGGEELALVMPDTSMDAAEQACERIRSEIEAEPWDEVRRGLRVTASVGLADGQGHDTVWHLLRAADQRLYAAKAAGRNQVVAVS